MKQPKLYKSDFSQDIADSYYYEAKKLLEDEYSLNADFDHSCFSMFAEVINKHFFDNEIIVSPQDIQRSIAEYMKLAASLDDQIEQLVILRPLSLILSTFTFAEDQNVRGYEALERVAHKCFEKTSKDKKIHKKRKHPLRLKSFC